jgi:hypothetical protein
MYKNGPSTGGMRAALCEAITSLTEQEATDDATVQRGALSETMLAVAGVKPIVKGSDTLESPETAQPDFLAERLANQSQALQSPSQSTLEKPRCGTAGGR